MGFFKIVPDKPPHSTHFVHVFSIEKVIQPHRSLAIYQNYGLMFRRKNTTEEKTTVRSIGSSMSMKDIRKMLLSLKYLSTFIVLYCILVDYPLKQMLSLQFL